MPSPKIVTDRKKQTATKAKTTDLTSLEGNTPYMEELPYPTNRYGSPHSASIFLDTPSFFIENHALPH